MDNLPSMKDDALVEGTEMGEGQVLKKMTVEHPYYDWAPMRAYCAELGMEFREQDVMGADIEFFAADLLQHQAEACFRSYAWRMKYFFTPQSYTYRDRIKIAFYFLFKRGE